MVSVLGSARVPWKRARFTSTLVSLGSLSGVSGTAAKAKAMMSMAWVSASSGRAVAAGAVVPPPPAASNLRLRRPCFHAVVNNILAIQEARRCMPNQSRARWCNLYRMHECTPQDVCIARSTHKAGPAPEASATSAAMPGSKRARRCLILRPFKWLTGPGSPTLCPLNIFKSSFGHKECRQKGRHSNVLLVWRSIRASSCCR